MLVLWWQLCDEPTRKEICMRLKSIYCVPGRIITVAGTVPDAMYMIRFGRVRIDGMSASKYISHGNLFGEMALMGLSVNGKRIRTSTAVSLCELCVLGKEHFEEIISMRPGDFFPSGLLFAHFMSFNSSFVIALSALIVCSFQYPSPRRRTCNCAKLYPSSMSVL